MAKRGWKSTHRVRFVWDTGIKGTITAWSLDEANMAAEKIRHAAAYQSREVTVTIETV